MKSYHFTTLTLLLEVLTLLATSTPSPLTPSCDHSLLQKINEFWNGAGTPQNVLQVLETSGDYVVVEDTIDILNGDSKCMFINGTASGHTISLIAIPKYKNQTVVSLVYDDVEDENGCVPSKKWEQRMYNILVSNNVLACYVCSTKEGYSGPPVGLIAINHKSWSDSCTQTTLKNTRGLMNMLGFNFIYEYGEECFK